MSSRRARAETTQREVLSAARTVFAEKGYRATTVAAVTAEAGVAHGTFYLYFENKEDVFVHVVSDALEELYQTSFTPAPLVGGYPDPTIVRERIAGFLTTIASQAGLWRAVLEGALASPVVADHWMVQRSRFHQTLAWRWRTFQTAGTMRPFDVEIAAHALGSMIEWTALSSLAFGPPGEFVVDDHLVDTLTGLWTRAVGVDP